MGIEPEFLRDVQKKGWIILAADGDAVLTSCPREGCNVRVKLHPGKAIPDTCARGPDLAEITVDRFESARVFLRDRRECLALTIREVEEIVGLTPDHLAKMEIDHGTRVPNAQTFVEWAQGLGYDVVLRPGKLPLNALRVMAETRDKLQMRRQKFRIHAGRRATKT